MLLANAQGGLPKPLQDIGTSSLSMTKSCYCQSPPFWQANCEKKLGLPLLNASITLELEFAHVFLGLPLLNASLTLELDFAHAFLRNDMWLAGQISLESIISHIWKG